MKADVNHIIVDIIVEEEEQVVMTPLIKPSPQFVAMQINVSF